MPERLLQGLDPARASLLVFGGEWHRLSQGNLAPRIDGKEPPEIQVDIVETPPAAVEADVLAFPVFDPAAAAELTAIDEELAGRLERLIADGEARGKLGETAVLHTDGEIAAPRIAAVGSRQGRLVRRRRTPDGGRPGRGDGDRDRRGYRRLDDLEVAPARSGRPGAGDRRRNAARELPARRAGRPPRSGGALSRLVLVAKDARPLLAAGDRASVVARWTNRCRDLVNAPANELTPSRLAETAIGLAEAYDHLSYESLARDEIVAAGMGAFAAVAQGSDTEPRLIVLEYDPPAARRDLVLGLVGKGITFDTGGISLKPAARMEEMKATWPAARPSSARSARSPSSACRSASSRSCRRPRTCRAATPCGPATSCTALNGKTIEITNTDAEGRLVLADALVYGRRRGATHLLDLATLTGAVVVALGDFYAGLIGNDDDWLGEIAGGRRGERRPRLARSRSTRRTARYIKSIYADMKNSSDLRQAGPIYAGSFLQEFAGDGPVGAPRHRRHRPPRAKPRRLLHGERRDGLRRQADRRPRRPPRAMNFDLGEERELLRRTVREFAEARIAPRRRRARPRAPFPYEIVAGLAELGLMGIPIPEEYGGARRSTPRPTPSRSRSSRAIDSSVAITVAAHTSLGTMPIYLFGTDEQQRRWLPELASGRRLAAFGLTEPAAGSDAGGTQDTGGAPGRPVGHQRRRSSSSRTRARRSRPA